MAGIPLLGQLENDVEELLKAIGEDIRSSLTDAISTAVSAVAPVLSAITSPIARAVTSASQAIGGVIGSLSSGIADTIAQAERTITQVVQQPIGAIAKVISDIASVIEGIPNDLRTAFDAIIRSIDSLIRGIEDGIRSSFDGLVADLRGFETDITGAVTKAITATTSEVESFIRPVEQTIQTIIPTALTDIAKAAAAVPSLFTSLGKEVTARFRAFGEDVRKSTPLRALLGALAAATGVDAALFSGIDLSGFVTTLATEDPIFDAEFFSTLIAGMGFAAGNDVFDTFFKPLLAGLTYEVQKNHPFELLDPNTTLDALDRGLIDYAFADSEIRKRGLDERRVSVLVGLHQKLLGVSDYTRAWQRGVISEDVLHKKLGGLSFNAEEADTIQALAVNIPSLADVVRYVTVLGPTGELSDKYAMSEGMPDDWLTYARANGWGDVDAAKLWELHWGLPSVSEGITMYYHGTIDREQLDDIFDQHAVLPAWRDQLIDASGRYPYYSEIHSAYVTGILNEEQTRQFLTARNYAPVAVDMMMETWKALAAPKDPTTTQRLKELTEAEILTLYSDGIYTRQQAHDALQSLAYDEPAIQGLLALRDYTDAQKVVSDEITTIRAQYTNGVASYNDTVIALNKLNLTATQMEKELATLRQQKQAASKLPTKSELDNMLKVGLITGDDYINLLGALGYNDPWPQLYLAQLGDTFKLTGIQQLAANGTITGDQAVLMVQGTGQTLVEAQQTVTSWSLPQETNNGSNAEGTSGTSGNSNTSATG